MSRLRLSTRLALAAAAAVCLAAAIVAGGAYVVISNGALDNVDSSLERSADEIVAGLSAPALDDKDFAAPPSASGAAPAPAPAAPATPADLDVEVDVTPDAGAPAADAGPRTIERDGRQYRILVRALPDSPDGVGRTVAVAKSLEDVQATIRLAGWALGLTAVLAGLLATTFVALIVRRALRPLRAAQAAADHIALSEDLSVRIPVGRPDEVGRLGGAMNTMLGRLEVARDRLRGTLDEQRRFAADASHELRTPLTVLTGDIELLRTHEVPAAERGEVLAEMAEAAHRMDRLVQGLLSLARVEAIPRRRPVPVDLEQMLADLLADRGAIEVTPPARVRAALGDPDAARSVLSNLVDNANRYGGGVAAASVALEDEQMVVVIADDGPGVPAHDRERVFDRFYRTAAMRPTPGAGLGLAIARGAAEAMGGSLRLLGAERGARFEFRLPAAPPGAITAESKSTVRAGREAPAD